MPALRAVWGCGQGRRERQPRLVVASVTQQQFGPHQFDPVVARQSLPYGPQHRQPYGIVHGGAYLFLADSAMGGALGTLAKPDERVITAQSEFRWLRPLEGATIRARARVLRRGRTLSHCSVELFDPDGCRAHVSEPGHGDMIAKPSCGGY